MKERIVTDTSNIFNIDYGDLILAGGRHYRVTGHERERRFGVEDPKFWVKRAVDSESGERKIIKLSFFETFETSVGGVKISCFRNPGKEAEILDLVKDHPHFMHGISCLDVKNNSIRVLTPVIGENFFEYVDKLTMDHWTYFEDIFPDILERIIAAIEAIGFLHMNGFKHGDIRNDHLIIERGTGNYVWIDFDYDFKTDENPFSLDIFELGNILLYAIGKGFHDFHMIRNSRSIYGDLNDRISLTDFSILDKWRFVNLRKLYPYIPAPLNNILTHFSRGAEIFYESVGEILEDLNRYLDSGK